MNNEEQIVNFLCSGPYSKEEVEHYFKKFNNTFQRLNKSDEMNYYFFIFKNMEEKIIDISLIDENVLFDELIKIPYNFKCINLSKESFNSIIEKGIYV